MKFDIWTFVFQVINFIVLLFILKRLLYKPIKEIMVKRRGLIEKTIEDAEKTKKEALELKQRHQEEMNKVTEIQDKMLERMKGEVEEEKKRMLQEAEKQARMIIEREEALFDMEKKRFEAELKEMALDTVRVFATNLLNDISDEELHEGIYRRLLNEIRRISEDIAGMGREDDSVTIDLISAYPVGEKELVELQKALESYLSKKVAINMAIDKTLIAGFKIKAYDKAYDFSLSGQINALKIKLKETA